MNLIASLVDRLDEFLDDHVDASQTRLTKLLYLALHDRLEGGVWCEQPCANTVDVANGEGDLSTKLLLVHFDLHISRASIYIPSFYYKGFLLFDHSA